MEKPRTYMSPLVVSVGKKGLLLEGLRMINTFLKLKMMTNYLVCKLFLADTHTVGSPRIMGQSAKNQEIPGSSYKVRHSIIPLKINIDM